jgi:hypothetical protein
MVLLHTLLVYVHLLATCAAIGTILLADLRVFSSLFGYGVRVRPPTRVEVRSVAASLAILYATGVVLVAMGMQDNPAYLGNSKLVGKLALVLALTANAVLLHRTVFPLLVRATPLAAWGARERVLVSLSASLSTTLWLYCAFLGIARPWNGTVSLGFVLGIAAGIWVVMFALVHLGLRVGSRAKPADAPDWVDRAITSVSGFAALQPGPDGADAASVANQSQYGDLQLDRRDASRPDRRRARRFG